MPYYSDDTISFSLEKYNQNIVPSFGGTIQYIWTCPSWVPFTNCNIRINKPYININLNAIADKQYIMYDVLYNVKADVLVNKIKKSTFYGFFVLYSQPNFNSYFNFTVTNSTDISFNDEINFKMEFVKKLNSKTIKENVLIQWNINTTQALFINGFSLPDFRVKFTNTSGYFNLTCTIYYRNNTFAKKSLSKSIFFSIPTPPKVGTLEVYPDYLIAFSGTRVNMIAKNFVYEDDPQNNNFQYIYFYLNPFNEYLTIVNKNDNPNQLSRIIMPITEKIKVMCYFNDLSYVEAEANISVKMNSLIDYNKIDDIFVYEVENAIILLETYALNLRKHRLAKATAENYGIKIQNKLIQIIKLNKNNIARTIIFNNIDKVATIMEAASYTFIDYKQINTNFTFLVAEIMAIADENNQVSVFSTYYTNNFIRALDNLLTITPASFYLAEIDITPLKDYYELFLKSFRDIPKGAYKMANLYNLNIFAITIDAKFLKKDVTYFDDNSVNPFDTISPIFIADNSEIYKQAGVSATNNNNLSVTIPNNVIEFFDNDFVVLINHYVGWNTVLNRNNTFKDDNWYSIHTDFIEVAFVDIDIYNTTSNSTKANGTASAIHSTAQNKTTSNTSTSTSTSNSKSNQKYKYTANDKIFVPSGLIVINFTMKGNPETNNFTLGIYNKTSCVKVEKDTNSQGVHEIYEDACNTWFDYVNNIIQCECDFPGIYSIAFNPQFKYLRKSIQFPQTDDSIGKYFLKFFFKKFNNQISF